MKDEGKQDFPKRFWKALNDYEKITTSADQKDKAEPPTDRTIY